jgi:hypothetical protein
MPLLLLGTFQWLQYSQLYRGGGDPILITLPKILKKTLPFRRFRIIAKSYSWLRHVRLFVPQQGITQLHWTYFHAI